MDLKEYKNSWAVITGASSGIGKEFAEQLGNNGINLILIARREDKLKKVSSHLSEKYNIKTEYLRCDLSDISSLDKIYDFCNPFKVEILVNNAGFGKLGGFNDMSNEEIQNMITVNCMSPVLLLKHFSDKMKYSGRGIVISLGSILSYFPTPYMSLYSATKAFNSFLGEGLIHELEKFNIKSYVVNPGSTETEFHEVANNNKGAIVRTPYQLVNDFLTNDSYVYIDGLTNKILIFLRRMLPRRVVYFLTLQFIKRNNKL